MTTLSTWHIQIGGQVQGVGFRPFVYQLALGFGLCGWVNNAADGVHIEFNADELQSTQFYDAVLRNAPPLSNITFHSLTRTVPVAYDGFSIRASRSEGIPVLLLSPDFALCEPCRSEISDQTNRRFQYAFTTCTQCGPRYSIIRQLPYDRVHTTMSSFTMCHRCEAEYNDPTNRRHFSQTNSCPDCSVEMTLWDNQQTIVDDDPIKILSCVCDYWHSGKIVAIKGIGGYLLTCDASNEKTVAELRRRKHRPAKPFALIFPDMASIAVYAHVNEVEATELNSAAAPIVVLRAKEKSQRRLAIRQIAPQLTKIGVMLPYTPLFHLLIQQFAGPVVATSGNLSHAPLVHDDTVALHELATLADYVLVHNREIIAPQDDSVVTYGRHAQKRIVLRRGRGFAPLYSHNIALPETTLLATGALLKSSFAVAHQQTMHVSQYMGDTDNYDAQTTFNTALHHVLDLFQAQPDVILIDQHPGYFAAQLGETLTEKWGSQLIRVPHHEAHFASVLGEHNLLDESEPILGVIWDGTGLGSDGQIWGGEFFRFYQNTLSRVAHVTYFKHFLGDKMATEPRLSAFSLCHDLADALPVLRPKFSATEWRNYHKLIAATTLKTSSVGRLFDAVASLLGLIDKASYEGEAAMLLEEAALRYFENELIIPATWLEPHGLEESLSTSLLIQAIVSKLTAGVDPAEIAAWFHVQLVLTVRSVANQQACRKLCFSGGVFQNTVLIDLLTSLLGVDYELYFNRNFSPNDENISFGQVTWYQVQNKKVSIK